MTAARQRQKTVLARAVLLGLALASGITAPPTAGAAGVDPTIVNAQTGLAISGFDPVAYFTDGAAKIGSPALELRLEGAVWRFRNEGNRAAFADRPDVYRPRFGGYDPVAIARGASVPGHPQFWAVVGNRLYLFYSDSARSAFMTDPGRIIESAERKWPTVARTIAP